MGDVKRYYRSITTRDSTSMHQVVLATDYDAALAREAALREELAGTQADIETIADHNIDLQQRLTAAEQWNATLIDALTEERRIRLLGQQENINWESLRDCRRSCYAKTDAALKPTESGATE